MEKLILAHDLGTSANKATLFREDGATVASATHPYSTTFGKGGVAEQNPDDWWQAVCISTRKLLENRDPGQIAAIALSGMMMGCLCVDRNGKPLRPHILYCDQRALAQADRFGERAGSEAVYRISGNRPNAVNSAAKYMWVKEHEPEIYRNTHKILNAKDYVNFLLTGRLATDPTDASGTNLYDLEAWAWSEKLIEAAELDADRLPEIVPSTAVLGELTSDAAAALGLRPGVPVVEGAADGICAGIGAGSVREGSAYICLGSSAWVGITADAPIYDPEERSITFAHAVPGKFQPMGTMLAGGSLYSWLRATLHPDNPGYSYKLMDESAKTSRPGANGLLFLPHLMGERSPRWDSLARGGWIGLDMTHTHGDMLRATLESVALNLEITVSIFQKLARPITEITMIGGGARSELWRQIMADITGVPILRSTSPDESTSIGAAIIAGVGAGIFRDFSVVDSFVSAEAKNEPNPANQAVHAEQKLLFDRTYKALEPLFPAFAALRERE